jgi:hypothetical protein
VARDEAMRTTNVAACQRCPWRVAAPTKRRHGTCCYSGAVVGVVDSSFTTRCSSLPSWRGTSSARRGTTRCSLGAALQQRVHGSLQCCFSFSSGVAVKLGVGEQGGRGVGVPGGRRSRAPRWPPSRPTTPIFLPSSSPHRRRCGLWFSSLAADTGARARRALYMWALGLESSHERQGCRGEDAWFPSVGASTTRAAPWVRPRARYGAAPSPDFPSQTSRGRKGHRVRLTSGSRASVKMKGGRIAGLAGLV